MCLCNSVFSFSCSIEALHENKQTLMTKDSKIFTLQAQVKELEAISAEKEALIAKYEAIFKESEGENIMTRGKKFSVKIKYK